jgi:hypothetical protein
MSEHEQERGWCGECGIAWPPLVDASSGVWTCPRCRGPMKRKSELNRDERSAFAFQAWLDEVWTSGKWGPSPGGAASKLQCDRSMIDKLSDRGILEKSVYNKDGQYVVMISTRSIEKAKENKEKRGKWTDSGED